MITVLVKYEKWNDAGHPMMNDFKTQHSQIVEVEKLTEINSLYSNIVDIKVLE